MSTTRTNAKATPIDDNDYSCHITAADLFNQSYEVYRAATFASQNDVKWCHHNFRGAGDTEISMVGAKLFGVAQLFALVST